MTQTTGENSDQAVQVSLKDVILKLKDWWHYLLSKWKVILCLGVLGSLLGLAYSLYKKPLYIAELSFALDDERPMGGGLSAAAGLASQFGVDIGAAGSAGGAFNGDNLLELMKSRSMVEKTLLLPVIFKNRQYTLAQKYIAFTDFHKHHPELKIDFPINVNRSTFSLQQDSVLGVFYKDIIKNNLTVDKVDKKLSIITVKTTSEDELFSKYFTENLVNTVSDFYIQTKTKKSSLNVAVLQRQTDSVRRELNSAITGVASSSDVNPNPNPALQIIRVPSLRRQVDVEANTAILGELVKNLEISKVSLRKETPLVQVIDNPILPLEKKKFGRLKGIVIGGFLFGLVAVLVLLAKKFLSDSLS